MNKEQIFTELQEIIVDKTGCAEEEVINEAKFTDDLMLDSLDFVELIMEIERKYKISIPDDDGEKLETVENAVDYLVGRLN